MADESYTRPEPIGLTKASVFRLAENVSEQLGLEPGADLYPVVKRLGGTIEVADTLQEDSAQSGSLYVNAPDKFSIIIPTHTGLKRDRFTIAHELGHFLLHYVFAGRGKSPETMKMMALRKDSERVEWEANWFASAFLMPGDKFKEIFNECGGDIEEVAEEFDVSYSAAEIRAKVLGLI